MERGNLPLRTEFIEVARPVVSVDVEKYKAFLDGSDMTESQKEEFLQALWSIVVTFVELGFGGQNLKHVNFVDFFQYVNQFGFQPVLFMDQVFDHRLGVLQRVNVLFRVNE